jgi:serine/threonine protein kinase
MPTVLGSTIAHYKVTAKLGQGGMGEVYRATDTKLDREVAIKVLPESFTQDRERLARFDREAKTLASVNHPNIASIYGLENSGGKMALVLELIEGETLAERLRAGAMPVEETLEVCRQIAEALEAAHEKGIIHRDLKPGNIKITPEGRVKVLDFGLAKATIADSSVSPSDNSQSPTLTADFTRPGVILGTAAYMSPEQARGKPVDKRTDNWSFGCVLYECLTGKRIFHGEDVTETLATVIKGEPDWSALPSETPATIQLLLRKCLAKDRKRRLHDIADARVDLEQAIADPGGSSLRFPDGLRQAAAPTPGKPSVFLAGLSVLACLATAGLVWFLKPTPEIALPQPREVRISLQATNGLNTLFGTAFALSPDGRKLVYAPMETTSNLRVMSLASAPDDEHDSEIPGTEGGHDPFFSPDGESVGFTTETELKIASLVNKRVQVLTDDIQRGGRGASWGANSIIYTGRFATGFREISLKDGTRKDVLKPRSGEYLRWPHYLPGNQDLLFMSTTNLRSSSYDLEVAQLATGNRRVLVKDCLYGRYVPSPRNPRIGHLLYVINDSLYAEGIALDSMQMTGNRRIVRQNLAVSSYEAAHYATANDGTLAYLRGANQAGNDRFRFEWIDLDGKRQRATQGSLDFDSFDLSPDEKTLAVSSTLESDFKLLNLDTGHPTRFADGTTTNRWPLWVPPDGQSIVFSSHENDRWGIRQKRIDFTEPSDLLIPGEIKTFMRPDSFSRDGKTLVGRAAKFGDSGTNTWRIWIHSLDKPGSKPKFLHTFTKSVTRVSVDPSGQWIVYGLNDELFLEQVNGTGSPRPLPTGRSSHPRWSRNGNRIFYECEGGVWAITLREDGQGMTPQGAPVPIIDLPLTHRSRGLWAPNADETRFLVAVDDRTANTPTSERSRTLNLIFNWSTELHAQSPLTGN